MNTHDVAPRTATIDRTGIRREGRPVTHRIGAVATAAGVALAIVLGACSPSASAVPSALASAVPSVDVSAGASLATGAALAALDQVDAAIDANETSGALTADDAKAVQDLVDRNPDRPDIGRHDRGAHGRRQSQHQGGRARHEARHAGRPAAEGRDRGPEGRPAGELTLLKRSASSPGNPRPQSPPRGRASSASLVRWPPAARTRGRGIGNWCPAGC